MYRPRPPLRLLPVTLAVLLLAGCTGDEPANAVVQGKMYGVGPVQGLRVDEAALDPFAKIEQTNVEAYFLNGEVLTIGDVDPETLLLVRAAPVLRDDPDSPWGLFVGLWGGGHDPDLCAYVDRSAFSFCE